MAFVFLTGGARSGKSAASLEFMSGVTDVYFIATAEALDDEMADRIDVHRRERPPSWKTIEAPRDLKAAFDSIPPSGAVIVDCLTLWVANLLGQQLSDDDIMERARDLFVELAARAPRSIVISNEVGSGIVPMEDLSRRYRDLLGRVNSLAATHAYRSYLVVAGRLLELSSRADVIATLR